MNDARRLNDGGPGDGRLSERELEAWLRAAWPDDACPAPETILEAIEGHLADDRRRLVLEHADACPACSAELKLASAFAAPQTEKVEHSAEVDRIARRLEASFGSTASARRRRDGGRLLPLRGLFHAPGLLQLAAAAVLVLVVAVLIQQRAPGLPEGGPSDTLRGLDIEVVAPRGTIAEAPVELVWNPVAGAVGYVVSLTTVDDVELWESSVADSARVVLPEEARARMFAGSSYLWHVEALGEAGRVVARSRPVRFGLALQLDPKSDPPPRGGRPSQEDRP